jgi:hypothetical protein
MATVTAIAPSHWAIYLMYGEPEGMDQRDLMLAARLIDELGGPVVTCEDYGVSRYDGVLTDCQTYTAIVEG